MTPDGGLIGHIIFIAVLCATIVLVAERTRRLVAFLRLGTPDNRFDRPWSRLGTVAVNVLGQRRLLNNPLAGTVHLLIFYGFIIITLGTIQLIAGGISSGLVLPAIGGNPVYQFILDVVAVFVLMACGVAVYRRLALRPPRLDNSGDAFVILGLIVLLMVSLLLMEAFGIRAGGNTTAAWSPAGGGLAMLFSGVSAPAATLLYGAFWWVHLLTVFAFAVYIPSSKHLHIVAAAPNSYFRQEGPKGALPPIPNIEEAEHFGVGRLEQFSWKHLLDLYSCTQCGRCDRNCPALLSDKPLSPKELIQNLKYELFALGDELVAARKAGHNGEAIPDRTPLVGGVIADETLWSCTTCRWCVDACPVMIEHVPKIVEMRRYLVLEESRFPPEVIAVFNNLEKNGNPWQMSRSTRGDWAKELGVRTMAEVARSGDEIEVLYFVGCMGSYDQRNKKVAAAVCKALQAAGVSFAILGKEEICNGDPARRIGNEYLYQMLAQENVETLNRYGVKKVLTACAHCFNTIKNEYPQFGGSYEVVHHTQFLTELIASGRLTLRGEGAAILGQGAANGTVTYHDPCYMGRYNDVYEEPRRALKSLPLAGEVVEMQRSRRQSFCCGGGGGRSFMEESQGKRISGVRLDQARETGAGTIAAGCPFCITMFEDGIKTKGLAGEMQVKDVSELIAAAIAPH
jgi:Fe-S oxidoreductase